MGSKPDSQLILLIIDRLNEDGPTKGSEIEKCQIPTDYHISYLTLIEVPINYR